MAVTPVRFVTGTGVDALALAPLPSCPSSLRPQHHAVPSPSSAHVCASPVTTPVAVVRPLTATGTEELVKFPSPLPSCPKLFRPQHCTVPSGRRIHVCRPPAATAVGVRAPLAVNCCVWPTPMVGFAGVTVMASADRQTRMRQRTPRQEAKSFNFPSRRLIESPVTRGTREAIAATAPTHRWPSRHYRREATTVP